MRPMMNSSPSEMKPKSPVLSHGLSGVPADASTSVRTEGPLGLVGFVPITDRDVLAVHPNLADRSRRGLDPGLGIDDPHHRRMRHAVTDQRCAAPQAQPLRDDRGQFLRVEMDEVLVVDPLRWSRRTPLLLPFRTTGRSPGREG